MLLKGLSGPRPPESARPRSGRPDASPRVSQLGPPAPVPRGPLAGSRPGRRARRATMERDSRSVVEEVSTGGAVAGTELDQRSLLETLQAVRNGDFSARLPGHWTGLAGKIADTFNDIVSANGRMARELKRVGDTVGKEGKTTQ